MKLDDGALPLTRGQLDIWLAQETGDSGTEWQLGLFVKIEGPIERDALERAIRHVVQEAEPVRAAVFEMEGQVFQRVIDHPDVEVAFYDLSGSRHPEQEARGIAFSIQRTPMPLAGPLFKFALFQACDDEFYLFGCMHHIIIDGSGIALMSIGLHLSTLQLFLTHPFLLHSSARCRTSFAASRITKRPPNIWKIRPIGAGPFHRKVDPMIGGPKPWVRMIRIGLLPQFDWTPRSFAGLTSYLTYGTCLDHRSSPRRAHFWCMGGALVAQRWCSTSRSPGECVRSPRRIPGWFPGWCRWC